ncbi:hypothetical protein R3O67_29440 [Bacillus cereus]|uniref:hypothetical protein n=1 Tax=Bacillus cereus TaxID=1396 RepID=UPI00307A9803
MNNWGGIKVDMMTNYFYVTKINSKQNEKEFVRNFAMEIKRTRYVVTKEKGRQRGVIEWGKREVKFEIRDNKYLFLFTNKKEDVLIIEKCWRKMYGEDELKLVVQEIPKGFFIGEHFSSNLIDFECNKEGLQAELWIENEEVMVVYDIFGYVTFTIHMNPVISDKVLDFSIEFLRKIDEIKGTPY